MRPNGFLSGLLCAGMVLSAAGTAFAGLPTDYNDGFVVHEVVVPKLPTPQELSTDLNRAPWTEASLLTGNIAWRTIRTADLPVQTYLFYDSEALYVGYRCEVTPGKNLRAEITERDADLKKDDHFTFELDVGATGRVFYRYKVNPIGNLYDSVIIDKSWNSRATIKTATDEKSWSAVMRLPFSDFKQAEPEAGTFWTFNLATRTGYDNSWAPVLGGYHIPEQFSRIVFSGRKMQPVRILEFHPLHAGDNALRVQAPAETRYLLEAMDGRNRVNSVREGAVSQDGRVSFQLLSDEIDHVNFTFSDAEGKTLLSFWRPAEIPPLTSRLPALRERAALVRGAVERFPEKTRTETNRLLARVETFLSKPTDALSKNRATLHKQLCQLERSVTDAWLYAQTLAQLSPKARFAVGVATPMDKVMIKDFPCPGRCAEKYDLFVARNEHEAMQVVVIPMTGPLKRVTVAASPVTAEGGQGAFAGRVSPALVGHVKTMPTGSYESDYVGWYPDPILDFQQTCDVNEGEHVTFWVDVATDKDAKPGDYKSTLTVSAEGCEPLQVQLNIHVWDITLPDGSHLRNAFTYKTQATKQLYKKNWTKELERKYYEFILDHRLNIDSLYGKEERDVELLRYGKSKGMNAFNVFYVGKGASPDVIIKLLQERMPAIQKAGLEELAYLYGFDEVNDEVFPRIKEIFGAAHKLYPNLQTMTTGYDNTFGRTTGLRDYVDIWVPLIPEYNMIEADRLRAEGKDMWWYLCVGPRHPYPNWFVESPTIEARLLMGAMSYKYRVGGVLYFATNGWKLVEKPIESGPYTDWYPGSGKDRGGAYANGDGSLFCAGPDGPVTTLRYENIRDGLEDYEYLYILADVVKDVAGKPASIERAAYLQHARNLLSVCDDVVESSSRYTREPWRLYSFRRDVAEAIVKGRELGK